MRSRLTIDAYIITSFDEHQKEDSEGRLRFISGFSGSFAYAVVSAWIELSFRWAIKFLFSSDNFSLRRAMDVFKIFGFSRSWARLQHLEYLLIKRWFIGGVVVGGKIVLMAYTQLLMLFWFGILFNCRTNFHRTLSLVPIQKRFRISCGMNGNESSPKISFGWSKWKTWLTSFGARFDFISSTTPSIRTTRLTRESFGRAKCRHYWGFLKRKDVMRW